MKTNSLEQADPSRLAIWTALTLALGIVLHRIFFLVALGLALVAPFGWLANWIHDAQERTAPKRRHA